MLINFRAGSLYLLFLLYIQLSSIVVHVFAAPVSVSREKSLTGRDNANLAHLSEYAYNHGTVLSRHNLESRDAQLQILVRRKSVSAKIKDAFKKAGQAIKKGFQKFGSAIKTAAKKVGNGIKTVAKKIGNGIKTAAKKVWNGVKTAAKKVGNGIKTAAKKVWNGVKTAAKKVGNGIKTAAKKVWSGVKTAAKKVGKFMKTTGAKIAKFGLKVMSTIASVGAKIVSFIPGVGKPLSKVLKLESKATEAASNAIHVSLGKKLDKGMSIMNKIEHPLGAAGDAVLDNVL